MKEPVGPCIYWDGFRDRGGYGMLGGSRGYAHRVAYEKAFGPIPSGMQIDHTCHTADQACLGGKTCPHRACVNPDHLEAVTQAENIRRGRSFMNERREWTHCVNGHEFTPENTAIVKRTGTRRCRECARAALRRLYDRRHPVPSKPRKPR